MIKFGFLLALSVVAFAYLELPVKRVPSGSKTIASDLKNCSAETSQVCYYKDISYCVQLFNNGQLYMMSIDFTIPISWIKHPFCKVDNSSKCSLLERSLGSSIKSSIVSIERKMRGKGQPEDQVPTGEMSTTGAMYPLSGLIERGENIHFQTKDSNKLFSLYKLFLVGIFLSDEKDHINLKNTNFINATSISAHTNKLSDGAISVRFDPESEGSFLDEIFEFVGEQEKTMTVYLGDNNVVTLGDLSSKNAADGYSSITWLPLHNKQFLMIDTITIQTQGTQKIHSVESSSQAVLTLSASYISFPKQLLSNLIKQLNVAAKCEVNSVTKYVECKDQTKLFMKKRIILEVLQVKINFKMEQLIKESGRTAIINLRESDSNYIIIGQPFFKKYYSAFDYIKNRIGIANRRHSIEQRLLSTITLVRFLMVVFLTGIALLACYRPTKRIIQVWNWYNQNQKDSQADVVETRRLKYSTMEVNNQYDDLNNRISSALNEDQI